MHPRKALFVVAILCAQCAFAHDVVPQAETQTKNAAQAQTGPKATSGAAIKKLGHINIDDEFTTSKGLMLRAREVTIAPGGKIGNHEHLGRPGVAYILEGELVEYRGEEGVVTRTVGDTAFEKTGVVHGWENKTNAPARALVVDLVPQEK
jgi:quercetin dioxygenase-like cupin family protein